jgi:hypothetical protein
VNVVMKLSGSIKCGEILEYILASQEGLYSMQLVSYRALKCSYVVVCKRSATIMLEVMSNFKYSNNIHCSGYINLVFPKHAKYESKT